MTSKDDFEARLNRIQQSRGIATAGRAEVRSTSDWALPRQPRRKRGLTVGFVVAGLFSLGIMTFAALTFIAKLGLTVPFSAGQEAIASLSGQGAEAGAPSVQAGWLDRLFGTGLARNSAGHPISYLPDAPAGWARITTADARQGDALAQLATRWPAEGGPLDSHPAYGDLLEFIRIHDSPDAEQRALSETRTRSLYLGPEGQVLSLRLQFRDMDDMLGSAADPASWANALRPEVMNAAQLGDTVESFDLGGLTVFNRAAQGQVGAAQRRAAAPLDLTVALHPRAVMEIRGIAQPSAAIALIEGVDRAALSTRLSQK